MKLTHASGRRRLIANFAMVITVILAFAGLTRMGRAAFLNYQVKNMTDELKIIKMKTVCAGRFLLDVPADADVSYRGTAVAGWDISTDIVEPDEQFLSRLKEKEAELTDKKNEKGMTSLEAVRRIDKNGVHGAVFMFDRRWIQGMVGEVPAQSVRLEALARIQNNSISLTAKYNSDKNLDKLAELVSQLRPRGSTELPKEEGFCFEGGIIVEPLSVEQSERTTMLISLSGRQDVSIMIDMTAGIDTPETLLDRNKRNFARKLLNYQLHTFREGPLVLAGMAGEQLLDRMNEANGTFGHIFMWEAVHNDKRSVFTPLMSFEMTTGNGRPPVNSTLTDAEALALWDKMLSSLRVRPVHITKPVASVPPRVPLGTLAYASERCPETGWWECNDGDKDTPILAGRQQYYRKGEGMGQAIQLLPTTPAQRLLSQRPTFTSKIPSIWKLVSRRQYPRIASIVALAEAPTAPIDNTTNDNTPDAERDAAMTPPGSMADSGMVCPASGWWRCVEANALDGTRWFGRGQNLPMATVRQPLSTLEKLKGTSDVTLRKTPWQLIRHDSGAPNSPADSATPDDNASTPA